MQCTQTDVAEVQSPKKRKWFDSSKVNMSEKKDNICYSDEEKERLRNVTIANVYK